MTWESLGIPKDLVEGIPDGFELRSPPEELVDAVIEGISLRSGCTRTMNTHVPLTKDLEMEMIYIFDEDVTKCGFRPLEREEWEQVVMQGKVLSDVPYLSDRRHRVLYLDGSWYRWETWQETKHSCFEMNPGQPITVEKFREMRFLISEMSKYLPEKWS